MTEETEEKLETQVEPVKEQKKVKGRTWSRITTGISMAVLVVCSILKWCGKLPNAGIEEVIAVSAAIKANSLPIDINMMIDKLKKR